VDHSQGLGGARQRASRRCATRVRRGDRTGGVHAFAVEADPDLGAFRSNEFELEWPPKSGNKQRFPEVDRIAWFAMPEAEKKILAYQLPLLDELRSKIVVPGEAGGGRGPRP
jgi:predicted NUDIX family NTP pyrophosphohydrolase